MLLVDDAHDRGNLGCLLEYAADPRHQTRIVRATRPYAEDRLRGEAAVYAITDPSTIALTHLSFSQTVEIAREVLREYGGSPDWAPAIVQAAGDSPLVVVMAARVIAKDGISLELAKNQRALRDTVLGKFTRVITGDLGSQGDEKALRAILDVLALIQPFHPEDPDLLALLSLTKDIHPSEADRLLRLLIDGGVIYRRGNQSRLMPDLLGDYIVENSCIGLGNRLSYFAETTFGAITPRQLSHVFVNLGRLDWRRYDGDPSGSQLLDNVWRKVATIEDEYDPRLRAVQDVAVYQPRQALDLVRKRIQDDRPLRDTPTILRSIAYNYDYLDEVCEILWAIGCDDRRDLNRHTNHPIRVLSDLISFEESKPIRYNRQVFDFALGLLKRDDVWHGRYTPLDFLKPILKGEGITTQSMNCGISLSPFIVDFDRISSVRRELIAELLFLLSNSSILVAYRAATFIGEALRPPMGPLGASVPTDLREKYDGEFRYTLESITEVMVSRTLHASVIFAIARSVSWQAQCGTHAVAKSARSVLEALPTDLTFRTYAALADGFGHVIPCWLGSPSSRAGLEELFNKLVTELKNTIPAPEELRHYLEEILADLAAVGEDVHSAYVLMRRTIYNNLDLACAIVADARMRTYSRTRPFLSVALSEVLSVVPGEGRAIAQEFFRSGDVDLATGAACAFDGLRREPDGQDLATIGLAITSACTDVACVAI